MLSSGHSEGNKARQKSLTYEIFYSRKIPDLWYNMQMQYTTMTIHFITTSPNFRIARPDTKTHLCDHRPLSQQHTKGAWSKAFVEITPFP